MVVTPHRTNTIAALIRAWMTIILILAANGTMASTITATLDKSAVYENEVVQLTLRTDFAETGNGPDLTPLKRDFDILGQSQNSQFRFNLGTTQSLNFWVISLMPKSVGQISIPPLKVGDQQSNALTLEVKPSPQLLDENGNAPVFMEMSVSEYEPYLQQQVILTVKLYTSVALQNANLSIPEHADLLIERLIDDQLQYQTIRGTNYQVLTREYLAFPQQSGTLEIPPQTVAGMIATNRGRRLVKVQTNPVTLQVLPIPASYPNENWLPAEKISIESSISPATDARVGDTLIWHININAAGALPEQIPPAEFSSTRDYKLYPGTTAFDSQKSIKGVIGSQSIDIEVVPTSQGTLQLPNIELTYWNTEQNKLMHVSRASPMLNIASLPSSGSVLRNQTDTQQTTDEASILPPQSKAVAPISLNKPQPKAATGTPSPIENSHVELKIKTNEPAPMRIWIVLGLVGVALAAILSAFWLRRKKQTQEIEDEVPTLKEFAPLSTSDEKSAVRALLTSCRNNDLSSLRANLLEWGRHRWGEEQVFGLENIKHLCQSPELTQLIMEAELVMYSDKASQSWDGSALADTLEEYISGQSKPSQSSQLKTLYPNF